MFIPESGSGLGAYCRDCNVSSQIDIDDGMDLDDIQNVGVKSARGYGLQYLRKAPETKKQRKKNLGWCKDVVEMGEGDVVRRYRDVVDGVVGGGGGRGRKGGGGLGVTMRRLDSSLESFDDSSTSSNLI